MPPISEKEGYLYVLYDGATDLCKIGMTKRTGQRQRAIMGGHGTSLINVLNAQVTDRFAAESQCHRYFDACRQNGEWFSAGIVEVIRYVQEHVDWIALDFENLARTIQYIAASKMNNQHAAKLALFSKGDRVMFVKEYRKKRQTKQQTVDVSRQKPLFGDSGALSDQE